MKLIACKNKATQTVKAMFMHSGTIAVIYTTGYSCSPQEKKTLLYTIYWGLWNFRRKQGVTEQALLNTHIFSKDIIVLYNKYNLSKRVFQEWFDNTMSIAHKLLLKKYVQQRGIERKKKKNLGLRRYWKRISVRFLFSILSMPLTEVVNMFWFDTVKSA